MLNVPLSRIIPNTWQTRRSEPPTEYIEELALDIARNGLLQNPVGRLVDGDGRPVSVSWPENIVAMKLLESDGPTVQLAFGHNRLSAFHWLSVNLPEPGSPIQWFPDKFAAMPVDIRIIDDQAMAIIAWSENERRRDHSPWERALALQKRIEDFSWTHGQAAEHLGLSRSSVTNILRLFKLPEDVQAFLQAGEITERQAYALLALFDLPHPLRTRAEINGPLDLQPSHILASAVEGVSADMLRSRIDRLVKTYARQLGVDPIGGWALDHEFEALGGRPACGLCEFRLERDGISYCGDPDHWRIRREQWLNQISTPVTEEPGSPADPQPVPPPDNPDSSAIPAESSPIELTTQTQSSGRTTAFPSPAASQFGATVTASSTPATVPPAKPSTIAPAPAHSPPPAPAPAAVTPPPLPAVPAPPPPADWEHSTITFTITFLPVGLDGSRPAMIGARANTGVPIMRMASAADLDLSTFFTGLLLDLKRQAFPESTEPTQE